MNRLTYWLWTVCIVIGFGALFVAASRFVEPAAQDNLLTFVMVANVISLGVVRFKRAQDMGSDRKGAWAWAILGAIPLVHVACGCYASSVDRRITVSIERALASSPAKTNSAKIWIPILGAASAFLAAALCNITPPPPPSPVATDTAPKPSPPVVDDSEEHLTYTYEVAGERLIIRAKGLIGVNEARHFNAWWDRLPPQAAKRIRAGKLILALDSPGGVIAGGYEVATWVKDNKVDTIVPAGAVCASACVMIWGAGAHKVATATSRIGVHGASTANGGGSESADGTVLMARALAEEDAPASVVAAVAITPSSEIHWLTAEDAVAWGAIMLDKKGRPEK